MWWDFLCLFFLMHTSKLFGKLSSSRLSLQRPPIQWLFASNDNGLLYCILFMITIDHFPSALCTVQCHLPSKIQTSIFLSSLFQYKWRILPAAKQILEILFKLSTWDFSPVKCLCRQAWNNMVWIFHVPSRDMKLYHQRWRSFAPCAKRLMHCFSFMSVSQALPSVLANC